MAPKSGDKVRVHYKGTLEDGSMFDSSEGRDPLEFVVGAGHVIPGFDAAVSDLEIGSSATVTIPAADAYGDKIDELVQAVPMEFFQGNAPQVGWVLQLASPDGQQLTATVLEVGEDEAVLDLNHPLAGKDLTFEITLVEIVEE